MLRHLKRARALEGLELATDLHVTGLGRGPTRRAMHEADPGLVFKETEFLLPHVVHWQRRGAPQLPAAGFLVASRISSLIKSIHYVVERLYMVC